MNYEDEITEDNPEVRLGYSADSNISFAGTLGTGYTREEWDRMTDREKHEVITQSLHELVEIFELGDDEPDYDNRSGWSR